MQDIFAWYRRGLLFYGPYRAYFGRSQKPFSEYSPKTQYSGDRLFGGAPERKEQQNEIKPVKVIETKPETLQKIESSQKLEKKNESVERQNEISSNKIGQPEYQTETGQTNFTKKRPVNPYDRVETGW